ncbi:hypothetical protein B0H63DRAFT_565722 [Podospora didyma]|uniref:Peptidase A1 domain-containing protein n=1 Tax=Podospora didyma TaxID=330526 RepID=A0AAE0N216_9PEZI|nr:hypothetical protein B0H63DRAFT_565722 [Podospora didyma]
MRDIKRGRQFNPHHPSSYSHPRRIPQRPPSVLVMDRHASIRSPGLWAAGLFVGFVYGNSCSAPPLVLPIRNVTFIDGTGMNRGVCLILGGQTQGLRLSTILNNTRVRNILDCPTIGNILGRIACEGSSGSVYDTIVGTFKAVYNLKDWLQVVSVVDPRPTDGTTVLQGYDVANFTDGPAVVPNFPFEVWANHDALNKSALALGPESSVLGHFVDNGLAPSRVYGIDYGSRSEAHPRDGQLTIGGHNEARHDSKNKAQFPMWGFNAPINCPLQVLLADVILTNDSGDHSLFSDPDSRVPACIDTIQNAFTFTPAMFAKWRGLVPWIEDDGSHYNQQTYPLDRERLMGTLTIKLANGYTTVIPHYEFVTHERGNDSFGKYSVLNSSRVMAAVNSGQTDLGNNVPLLGGVFLSQNYLGVDYASNSFWLSPQVGNGTLPDKITPSCTASSSPGNTSTATPLGPIIGGSIGGVALLAVLTFLAWSVKKRKGGINNPPAERPPDDVALRPLELRGRENPGGDHSPEHSQSSFWGGDEQGSEPGRRPAGR